MVRRSWKRESLTSRNIPNFHDMSLRINVGYRLAHFKQPAGTSRGVYLTRNTWIVTVRDTVTGQTGVGECAPLPDLSCDAIPDYEQRLRDICRLVEMNDGIDTCLLRPYPSMLFGLETAMLNLQNGGDVIFDTPFTRGEEGIPINGLVWMGTAEEMTLRVEEKLKAGFRCVKLKIGAIDFEQEVAIIKGIRDPTSLRCKWWLFSRGCHEKTGSVGKI